MGCGIGEMTYQLELELELKWVKMGEMLSKIGVKSGEMSDKMDLYYVLLFLI